MTHYMKKELSQNIDFKVAKCKSNPPHCCLLNVVLHLYLLRKSVLKRFTKCRQISQHKLARAYSLCPSLSGIQRTLQCLYRLTALS